MKRSLQLAIRDAELVEAEKPVEPRPRRRRRVRGEEIVAARAVGDGVTATAVTDGHGRTAGAVTISREYLASLVAEIEMNAEKRRAKEEREQKKMLKHALIAAAVVAAVWWVARPQTPEKTA